jgi:hypothetical protein
MVLHGLKRDCCARLSGCLNRTAAATALPNRCVTGIFGDGVGIRSQRCEKIECEIVMQFHS